MLSNLVIAYLFLGGTGAGCAFVCSVLGMMSDRSVLELELEHRLARPQGRVWSKFFAPGYAMALACLLLGAVCLCADLGQPSRMLMVLFPPKISYLSFGAWSIVLCMLLCMALLAIWAGCIRSRTSVMRGLSMFGLIVGFAVMVYTGLLLSSMAGVPVWNTVWLVVLFCLSSLSCGVAALLLASFASGGLGFFLKSAVSLLKLDTVLIVCECATLFILLFGLIHVEDTSSAMDATSLAAITSMGSLVFGELAGEFWFILIGCGLLLPFCLEGRCIYSLTNARRAPSLEGIRSISSISSVAVLVGGAALRYLIVAAAAHPSFFM